MALHIREQIMQALVASNGLSGVLVGLATTGSNVTRARVYNIDTLKLPHISVFQGADEPIARDGDDESTNIYLYNRFNVHIEITNNASSGILETEINQICKEIIIALMSDTTLGGLAINTIEVSTSKPDITDEYEKRLANTEMIFEIQYYRLRTDPSQT